MIYLAICLSLQYRGVSCNNSQHVTYRVLLSLSSALTTPGLKALSSKPRSRLPQPREHCPVKPNHANPCSKIPSPTSKHSTPPRQNQPKTKSPSLKRILSYDCCSCLISAVTVSYTRYMLTTTPTIFLSSVSRVSHIRVDSLPRLFSQW